MILIIHILFLMLSAWIAIVSVHVHDCSGRTAKGFYSFFEPRFKVDLGACGCVARQFAGIIHTPGNHVSQRRIKGNGPPTLEKAV